MATTDDSKKAKTQAETKPASSTQTAKPAEPTKPVPPPAPAPTQDGAGQSKPEQSEAEKQAQKENADAAKAQRQAEETAGDNVQAAIAPAIEGVEDQPEVKERVRRALGNVGESPAPTMVNGKSVAGKKYDVDKDQWVDDPDAQAASVRASDIFDRIGEAFPHESQRMVIEELARHLGLDDDSTDLPEGMPAQAKSTASLRTDVSGYGRFTGGGPGVKPVAPNVDGKAQVE